MIYNGENIPLACRATSHIGYVYADPLHWLVNWMEFLPLLLQPFTSLQLLTSHTGSYIIPDIIP